ncbi:CBS domain-containing protein [Streptomyces sp. NPDC047985]|uniref:CBS domain-containing protein n=1 Tax=unclassified Streptomyces TaxID=2593676 RepID=UPI0034458EB1
MSSARYTVDDVMTRAVVTVAPDTEFKEIVTTMERWKITAVPVVDDESRVVGVVSEADLLAKEEFRAHPIGMIEQMRRLGDTAKAGSVRAGDLMSSPAVTVRPDASLPQAARLMAEQRVKRLPVVDDFGGLKGVVSRADLLKVFLRADGALAADVHREVVDRLLPAGERSVEIAVAQGVVTLSGHLHDSSLIPVAARLAQSVEGVVDVDCRIEGAARV